VHNTKYKTQLKADNVILAPGSKELLYLVLFVVSNNLSIPTPAWVSHINISKVLDRPCNLIHCTRENRYKITPEQIERSISEKPEFNFLLLNYPNNPTG
jgi:aspartate aminotransferase